MPRPKVDYKFTIELMDSNKPTKDGRLYPLTTLASIAHDVTMGTKYYVNEFSPVERELKKVRLDVVWDEKIMGTCIDAEVKNGKLYMTIKCASNKNGLRLKEICENVGVNKINWFPVGYGNTVDKNSIKVITDYKLIYIAF